VKKYFFIVFVPVLFIFNVLAAEPELIVIAGNDKIMLGEKIELTLLIKDNELDNIVKSENYQITAKPDNILIKFEIKPDKIGKLKIGPYKINYQGNIIKSDVIEIEVTENIPVEENKILIEISRVVKSHSIVVLNINSSKFDLTDVLLPESAFYKVIGSTSSSSMEIKQGEMKKNYLKNIEIIFLKKGKFTVNASIFKNLPEFSIIDEVTIDIE